MKAFRFENRLPLATVVTSVCFLALIHIQGFAQEPSTPGPAATPKVNKTAADTVLPTGTIKGRVVSDDGRPINNASIAAGGSGAMAQKMTRVDAEGRFVLEELPATSYTIMAVAPGYVDQKLLQADPGQQSRYLIGSQLKIVMLRGGVITGTVTDSKGQPVVGVPVSAAPVGDAPVLGAYMMGMTTGAETDDRGVYRIFGLAPGQYTVTAGGGGPYGLFNASGFDLDVPTYYPSGTRDTALPVSVRAGEETASIDIKYRGTEGHSISGRVTGAVEGNAAMGAVTITLSPASTSSVLSLGVVSPGDERRSFGFNGVGDGEYDLLAMFQSGITEDPLVGTKRVTVRGGDVTGVEINLARLAAISGTITLDPIKPDDMCDKRNSQITETIITPLRDEPRKPGSQVMTQIFGAFGQMLNAKGEFASRNLESGRYRLAITLPSEAWYVRSITTPTTAQQTPKPTPSQAAAGWQGTITLKSGERINPVSIMIGQDGAGLRGRVEVPSVGAAIPANLRVHLVPLEREEANNVLRYSETLVGSDGSFAFSNLAPGRYLLVTIREPSAETGTAIHRPAAFDPITRSKVRREAETANTVVELKPCQQVVDYKLPMKKS